MLNTLPSFDDAWYARGSVRFGPGKLAKRMEVYSLDRSKEEATNELMMVLVLHLGGERQCWVTHESND